MASIEKYFKARTGVDTPDLLTSSATVYDYLKTPLVYFDTTASALNAEGGLVWSDGEGTLSLRLKNNNIDLAIGQEELALCYNGTGSALSIGQVVRIIGAQGQKPSIGLATAENEAGSSKTFGLVAEPISNGSEGFVSTFGVVSGIDTSTFTEGQALWLSASAGKFTNVMPTQPYHGVFIGYCLKSHESSGRIFVKIQNGYELEELHNVLIQSASTNDIIYYNSASSLWQNKNLQNAIKEVDGSGSGIDADLLDGQQGSYYAPINSPTFTGSVTVPTPIGEYHAATKGYVDQMPSKATVSSEFPLNPVNGSLYFDINNLILYVYASTSWLEVGSTPPIDGGLAATLEFNGTIDGGLYNSASFDGIHDLGNYQDIELLA